MATNDPSSPTRNRLLASLAPGDAQRLGAIRDVPLAHKTILGEPGERIEYAYFPHTGLVSLVTLMEDGDIAESGTIGLEVQISGTATRFEEADLLACIRSALTHAPNYRR
jgi:hypothetical protein